MAEAIDAVVRGVTSNIATSVQGTELRPSPQSQFSHQQTFQTTTANVGDALLFRDMNAIRDVQDEKLKKPSVLRLAPRALGKYGVGLELYFSFLKLSSVLFFFVAVISIWPIVMNVKGGYLMDGETNSSFDTLTLANQDGEDVYSTNIDSANETIDNTKKYQIMTLVADVTYTVLFICFLVYYRVKSADAVDRNLEQNLLPSDYAIEIKGLPLVVEDDEVAAHFKQFGEVVEVSLARNYNGKLLLYADRSRLSIELGIAKRIAQEKGEASNTKITILESRIQRFDDRIAKKNEQSNRPHTDLPVNRAYVIFNRSEERQNCYTQYRNARRFCQSRKKQPANLQFLGKYPLKVKRPPEPSNILWENLEVKSCSRRLRRLFAVICTLALMIMSVALMYWLKSNDTGMPRAYECRSDGIEKLSFTEAQVEYTDDGDILCWCLLEGITSILQSSKKQTYCDEYVSLWQKSTYIRVLSSIGIIAINFILKFFLRRISRFERVSTVTKEQQKIMFKIFLAMFVNTAFINLVVNSNFQDFKAMQYVPFKEYMFDGDYDDFTRDWYLRVGSAIVVTMLISMVSPHFLNFLIWHPIKQCRICCCRSRRRTQHELNQLYLGAEYDIAGKTAIILNILFSCFLYSGGIPLLNAICFCSLFFLYWIEKYLIVNYYRKPPVYDHGVNQRVMSLLPYAILLHCGFSFYMYGSDAIWPLEYDTDEKGSVYPKQVTIYERIYRFTGIVLIIVMICTLIVAFFAYALAGVLRRIRSSKVIQTKKPLLTYKEALEEMKHSGVASYDVLANPRYTDLIIALDHSAMSKGDRSTSSAASKKKVRPDVQSAADGLSDTQINNYLEAKD